MPVQQKLKSGYLIWVEFYRVIPKIHRYSLAVKIDIALIESIEMLATASFLYRAEKIPYVRRAIQKIDTAKLLLLMLWETKSLTTNKYAQLAQPLEEVGKMLGGWHGQLQKQNSLALPAKEK